MLDDNLSRAEPLDICHVAQSLFEQFRWTGLLGSFCGLHADKKTAILSLIAFYAGLYEAIFHTIETATHKSLCPPGLPILYNTRDWRHSPKRGGYAKEAGVLLSECVLSCF